MRRRCVAFAALPLLALLCAAPAPGTPRYDVIIRHGTIADGSGLAPYVGDVGILGDRIAAVGDLGAAQGATTVEARGLVVAPGFINIHSHARPDAVATAVNMLTQAVTTEIGNADGQGTTDVSKQLAGFAAHGLAENLGLMIGFNTVWQATIGEEDRRATPDQITAMQRLLDRNLATGAWGVSAGLDYKPGYYADRDEVIAILASAKRWRTIFPNHERLRPEENYSSFKGISETLAIGAAAGVTPVITHIKTQGAEQGNAPAVIALMNRTIAAGTYTAADVYPYRAGLSGLTLALPGWALEGGRPAMLKRFADPATRARIIGEAERAMRLRFGGPSGVRVLDTGQELTDAMARWHVGGGEALIRLLEQQDYAGILTFGREDDVIAFLRYRNSSVACDCGATLATLVHPRTWGTFPRVLGQYVRDTHALTLAEAVRKMTALPAATIGMSDRGYLAPGMMADVAIFDPRTIADHATYARPTLPSEGVRQVFVNGRPALRDGAVTAVQGGRLVLRTAWSPSRPMTEATTARRMAGSGEVGAGAHRYRVSFALTQAPGQPFARGRLQLVEQGSGTVWTADRLGVVQTAPGWASTTAMLRNSRGALRPATLTVEGSGGLVTPGMPALVLELGGEKVPLTGHFVSARR